MRSRLLPALAICTAAALSLGACSSSGSPAPTSTAPASGSSGGGTGSSLSLSSLTGTSSTVTLDKTFLTEMTALHIKPATSGKAKIVTSGGSEGFSFPISGGKLDVSGKTATGTINHAGSGLSLDAAGTTVVIDDLVITTGANGTISGKVTAGGKVVAPSLALFDLDPSTLTTPQISGKTVTLSGYTVYVDSSAAQALNLFIKGAAKLPTTKNAIKVGTATIVATGS